MKRVLITGSQMGNKGAQAMLFITMDECARRWPDATPTIFGRRAKWDPNLKCDCVNIPGSIQLLMQVPVIRSILKRMKPTAKKYDAIMRETAALIDVSGYAIGKPWSKKGMINYALTRMAAGKHYHFPVYLMPQSFGPFAFRSVSERFVKLLLKHNLPKANVIMAREKQGAEALRDTFSVTKNVCLQPDLVLQNKGIQLENVYRQVPVINGVDVLPGSVAIVPNQKTIQNDRKEMMLSLYRVIISGLMEKGKHVYLVYHSSEDFPICGEIKALFPDEPRVIVVERELSCLEYLETVGKFDYIIASRFHSIVLAYRQHTPTIVLGWAVKYQELLGLLGQQDYVFDVRKVDEADVLARIEKMEAMKEQERSRIAEAMARIQSENVYDLVHLKDE